MDNLFIYHMIILVIVFLLMLNGYLRGSIKGYIDAIFGILLFVLIVIGFIIYGWKIGIANIIAILLYSVVTKRFAKKIAYKLLGRRTSFDTGEKSSMKEFIDGDISLENYFDKMQKETEKDEDKLQRYYNKPEINNTLNKYNKSFDDYVELYQLLKVSSVGSEVAFDIVSSPKDLHKYYNMKEQGHSHMDIISYIIR